MTRKPSAIPYQERLRELIPGWARVRDREDASRFGLSKGQGLLNALTAVLGSRLDRVQEDVLQLFDNMFIETCDPRLIPLIGHLVGVQDDPALLLALRRYRVKYALHLHRRKGTRAQLERVGWQQSGFRVQVLELARPHRTALDFAPSSDCDAWDLAPQLSSVSFQVSLFGKRTPAAQHRVLPGLAAAGTVRVCGASPPIVKTRAIVVTGCARSQQIVAVIGVRWPVRRRHIVLTRGAHDVYEVLPGDRLGFRRADGTPIFLGDDPSELVGPGKAIDLTLGSSDFERLGPLRPVFARISGAVPVSVPHHTLLIDPENGRIAGPTPPMPGLRKVRSFRAQIWAPFRAEEMIVRPAPQGDGVFTFAEDSQSLRLTDDQGFGLRLAFQGSPAVPATVAPEERLLVIREYARDPVRALSARNVPAQQPYALLRPGTSLNDLALNSGDEGILYLDARGLSRFFAIEDEWGWELFRRIHLVDRFSSAPPRDDTVEVDVGRGRFRVGPAIDATNLRVRFYRRYDVEAHKRRTEQALRDSVPLGRTITVSFRDTALGTRGAF